MATQLSVAVRNAAADAVEAAIGASAVLKIRTGAAPANCSAADAGTVLATMALPADYFGNASGGSKALQGSWLDNGADASGDPAHFRLYATDGITCHIQGLVSVPHVPSRAYAIGAQVHTGGNIYRATVAGVAGAASPPTGTGASIADGAVTWTWVQSGVDMTLDAGPITAAQQISVGSFTLTIGGA